MEEICQAKAGTAEHKQDKARMREVKSKIDFTTRRNNDRELVQGTRKWKVQSQKATAQIEQEQKKTLRSDLQGMPVCVSDFV